MSHIKRKNGPDVEGFSQNLSNPCETEIFSSAEQNISRDSTLFIGHVVDILLIGSMNTNFQGRVPE